jgi:hypothetical protein
VRWVLLGALAVVLSLDAWGLRIWPGIFDPAIAGTWGEFAAAALTLVAITTALYQAGLERRRGRIESLCSVSSWLEARQTGAGERRWHLLVENGTKFPIFGWWVRPSSGIGWHLCSSRHGPLVPGLSTYVMDGYTGSDQAHAVGVEIMFQDREGSVRLRQSNGILLERGPADELREHLSQCASGPEGDGRSQ